MGTPAVTQNSEKPKEQSAPDRSTIRFPYLDQDDAVSIAKKIFEIGGKSCEKVALAAGLDVSADGGGFNLRIGTAKMFGFISGEKKTLSLTDLGARVVDSTTEKAARAESFLQVPLYKAVYEDWNGQALPANPALETYVEKLGVAPKQKDKARQVLQRSASQAGFFAFGNNRLVAPQFRASSPEDPKVDQEKEQKPEGPIGGGNGGGNYGNLHPFIQGLLGTLPKAELGKPKELWPLQGRQDWLQTAANMFNLIYLADGDEDKGSTLSVLVNRPANNGSAK